MKIYLHQTTKKLGFAIVLALLLVTAFNFGVGSFAETLANPQSSYAEESVDIQSEIDNFLAQPLTEEEKALMALDTNSANIAKLHGTVVKGSEVGLTPFENFEIKFDGISSEGEISKSTLTNDKGYYSIEVPRYSKGILYYEFRNEQESNIAFGAKNFVYVNVKDTITDFYHDFLYNGEKPVLQEGQHFAVVNHVDNVGLDTETPVGSITTVGTIDGITAWDYSEEEVAKARIMYDINVSGSRSQNSVQHEYKTQVVVDGQTIKYSFEAYGSTYSQSIKAVETNSDYVFDGWYKTNELGRVSENSKNDINNKISAEYSHIYTGYQKVYSGDYLYDFVPGSFGFNRENESNSAWSDGAFYIFVARFVPKASSHKITFKVTDDTTANQGFITGSNGNSDETSSNYLKQFDFNVDGSSMFALNVDREIDGNTIAISNLEYPKPYVDPYELNWTGHTTAPSYFNVDGFVFKPLADAGYSFNQWEIRDEQGEEIQFPSTGYIKVDQDLTFIASFLQTKIITGQILSNGQGLAGASVSFRDGYGFTSMAQCDDQGKYSIEITKRGGFLTAGKNGYSCETEEISGEAETVDITLSEPENPVYLSGNTYCSHGWNNPELLEENKPVTSSVSPLSDVIINYYTSDNKNYTYYVGNIPLQTNPVFVYPNSFEMPIPAGSEGTITFSHNGYQTMSFDIKSEWTQKTEDKTLINVAEFPVSPDELYPGSFVFDGENNGVVLATGENISVYVAVEDMDKGNKILVSNQDGHEPKALDYTAGTAFRAGDTIDVDYLTGTLTITTPNPEGEQDFQLICTPDANTDDNQEFFGWVGYTNYGERFEFMSHSVLQTDLRIYAQFKKAAYLTTEAANVGHESYTMSFYSNELKHVGDDEPIVVTDETLDPFRQYVGSKYSVSGNVITCEYDESWENPGEIGDVYKESTTLTANAKAGYTFDYWLINGEPADEATDVIITEENLDFHVQAVYKANEEPEPPVPPVNPSSEDVNATAATGDNIPFAVLAICGVALIVAGAFACRKYFVKK